MAKSQTIKFTDEEVQQIEDYRRSKTPIPAFSVAVKEILQRGLKA